MVDKPAKKQIKKPVAKKPVVKKIECVLVHNSHIDGKLLKAGSKIMLGEKTALIWKRKNKIK